MDPSSHKTQEQQDFERAVEVLPESVQRLCHSGQSVQNLAHLVKNILQMTSGSVEIIELGLGRKQYDRIERSWGIFEPNFMRMKKFILDLIKYTKDDPLQKTECDFNSIVSHSIQSCEYILKNKEVNVQLQKDKASPSIELDADRVEEMIANLITHALDNLPEHQGTIQIQTLFLKDHCQVQVSVCDDGPTLTNDVIRSLSKPLERAGNMVGTGFDIPLAKLCVEKHGGYMEFESTHPKGNCVHAYLPIQ
jgi:two-component system cell cycle sensor histidine kinase PleC